MKRWIYICITAVIMTCAVACKIIESAAQVDKESRISSGKYRKDGIEGHYPKIISGGSEENLKMWNRIIQEDFNKILDIYSFNPFPELTPVPSDTVPIILKINFNTKLNDKNYLSILYRAAFNAPYTAHPTDLVYTTNISKKNNQRLKLSDIVNLDESFVKDVKTWDIKLNVPENEEFKKAVKDYLNNLSDEDLLMGLQAADIIGTGNLNDIYSYLTQKRLGISLGVPNYIGDHIELEREYSKLGTFLKPDFRIK